MQSCRGAEQGSRAKKINGPINITAHQSRNNGGGHLPKKGQEPSERFGVFFGGGHVCGTSIPGCTSSPYRQRRRVAVAASIGSQREVRKAKKYRSKAAPSIKKAPDPFSLCRRKKRRRPRGRRRGSVVSRWCQDDQASVEAFVTLRRRRR